MVLSLWWSLPLYRTLSGSTKCVCVCAFKSCRVFIHSSRFLGEISKRAKSSTFFQRTNVQNIGIGHCADRLVIFRIRKLSKSSLVSHVYRLINSFFESLTANCPFVGWSICSWIMLNRLWKRHWMRTKFPCIFCFKHLQPFETLCLFI